MACYCREAANSLVEKLTQLMENRPVVRDLLQGLTTDELFQVWKMVLEMAYGIQDWTDPKLAATNVAESETERRQIREIQAMIHEARGRCRSYDGRLLGKAPPTSGAGQQDDGGAPSEATLDDCGQEKKAVVGVDGPKDQDDADVTLKPSSIISAGDNLRNVSIQFGSLLPVFAKQCMMMNGENYSVAASSLSSKLIFRGANLLRKGGIRARRPKKFIQIGAMQVELPT